MEDLSASTKDSNVERGEEEEVFSDAHDEARETSPAQVSLDISAEREHSRRRILHRVPPYVRKDKESIYDPVVLSLGPYHHGQPQFRLTEELKDEVLDIISRDKDKDFLHRMILERVDEIRHFYGGVTNDEYGDEALAEMMLRDACLVLYYMKMYAGDDDGYNKYRLVISRIGISGSAFMLRDFLMLENQIPFWAIKLLISLTSDDDKDCERKAFLCKFLSVINFLDPKLTRVPWEGEEEEEEEEPLHLLEAHRMTLVREEKSSSTVEPIKNICHWIFKSRRGQGKNLQGKNKKYPLRSATELKAKGIYFEPSSNCLKDIRFTSYWFYGKLQLPIRSISNNTHVFFSNLIAFEMSPETDTDLAVISYINFMKSLIDSPKDVKELREQGILFSDLANDEEVVKMFKEINTYGFDIVDIFQDVKMGIQEHCSSKTKTWMLELTYTYFRSPWTAIALFAATFLLCLTFLQTYYTINPRKNGNN